jgi:hypothetical protein
MWQKMIGTVPLIQLCLANVDLIVARGSGLPHARQAREEGSDEGCVPPKVIKALLSLCVCVCLSVCLPLSLYIHILSHTHSRHRCPSHIHTHSLTHSGAYVNADANKRKIMKMRKQFK